MSLFFLIFGFGMLYQTTKNQVQRKKDLAVFLRTEGQVVDLDIVWGLRRKCYSPKVSFKTNQNQVFYFTPPYHSSIKNYRVGQKAEVYFNPENPEPAEIVEDGIGKWWSGSFIAPGKTICNVFTEI